MLCAPGMLVDATIRRALGVSGDQVTPVTSVVGLIYIIGWVASMIGFRRLRLTGDGVSARVVFALQMIGLTLAATQQFMELSPPSSTRYPGIFGICDTAWPISHLFMLVVGGMVLAKARVQGPTRFAPLGCGLALPLTAVLAPLNHYAFVFGFGVITTLCFGLVGLTVYLAGTGRDI